MKLNLGCGVKKEEGFINVDKVQTEATDEIVDLFDFPWPWADKSAEEIRMIHFFEHVPAKLRGKFMDELFRVLADNGVVGIIIPAYNSQRYYQDFTHEWPPLVPASFLYFNKEWREREGLQHGDYDLTCDFESAYGYNIRPEWKIKADDVQKFGVEHYWNVATDLIINLTKRS